jgi:hypothetical protein
MANETNHGQRLKDLQVSFRVRRKADGVLIKMIAERGAAYALEHRIAGYDVQTAAMDITACHLNGCPLRLRDLLNADDFNFAHDLFGINRHLNHETGKLEHCFRPRFAERVSA